MSTIYTRSVSSQALASAIEDLLSNPRNEIVTVVPEHLEPNIEFIGPNSYSVTQYSIIYRTKEKVPTVGDEQAV